MVDAGAGTALLVVGAGQVRRHAVHTGVDITRSCVQAVLSAALLILPFSAVLTTLDAGACRTGSGDTDTVYSQ